MKKKFIRFGEALCVLLLAAFIAYVSSADSISTVPFEEASKAVTAVADIKELKARDELEFREKLSLTSEDYTAFAAYSSESVMDVRELVIIFTDNKEAQKKIKANIEAYVAEREALFDGYAPKESEMISSHTLVQKKGYTLFYIGQDKEKVISAFSEKI